MEWREDGVLLAVRPHGERSAILETFTRSRGRCFGLARGALSKKRIAELQPGAQLDLHWRGRLEEQLGGFQAEAIKARAGLVLDDRLALAAMNAILGQISAYFPERDPQPELYDRTIELLDALTSAEAWPGLYGAWELKLLETLGYGLDLTSCAATGSAQDLIYVSPRSGRAVSRGAGAPYQDKLLPLPSFLRLGGPADWAALAEAMRLSGRFLEHWAAPALGLRGLPEARHRFAALITAQAVGSG